MIITLRDVHKTIGGTAVLEGVQLAHDTANIAVVFGPNGSGKSTLLRLLAGVTWPTDGSVTLDGLPIADDAAARRRIGFVPENPRIFPHLTVAELLTLVAALKRTEPADDELFEKLGLRPYLGQQIETLSLGQARRAALVAAQLGDPELLVLDEPTNGLASDGVAALAALLRERQQRGKGAVIATHDHEFAAEITAQVYRLEHGRLVGCQPAAEGRRG